MDYGFDVPEEYKDKEWWNIMQSPSRISDQYFGFEVNPEDFGTFEAEFFNYTNPEALQLEIDTGYSNVVNNDKLFKIELALGPFPTKGVRVSYFNNLVIIRLEHKSKKEGQGSTLRKIERTYVLPVECDLNTVNAIISPGKLEVTCGKKQLVEREIKVNVQSTIPT